MKQNWIIITALMISLVGCQSDQNVQIEETSSESVSYTETIHMNNCGGKDTSEQTAQKSFSTSLEGTAELKLGYEVVEGSVSGKYGQYQSFSKSQTLKAPAGTNMEFILKWAEDVRAGNVMADGQTATYTVHIPVAVELVSSKDLGCEENWAIEFQNRFPENFWSIGNHEYTIEESCPENVGEEPYGKWTHTFNVSDDAPLLDGDVFLRLSGLVNYETNTTDIQRINPGQPTVIAFGFVDGTKEEIDSAREGCIITASWDTSEPIQLPPSEPYQRSQ